MAGRIEYKYLVPNSLVSQLRSELEPFMEIDRFADKPSGEYTVRSVYYDTARFDCYEEKLSGLCERRKFRIRGYDQPDEDSVVFLEIKKKRSAFIEKCRAPVSLKNLTDLLEFKDVDLLVQGGAREKRDARSFLYHYERIGLRPAVLVVYDREAFQGKFDPSLRLTFDKNLRGSIFPTLDILYEEDCLMQAMPGYFTLEVKFFRNALPHWVRSLVKRYELPRMALSKYATCLDTEHAYRRGAEMRGRVFSPAFDMPLPQIPARVWAGSVAS